MSSKETMAEHGEIAATHAQGANAAEPFSRCPDPRPLLLCVAAGGVRGVRCVECAECCGGPCRGSP